MPKLSCSATEALGSTWLGVGGWDGSTLLQIGTYDQCIGGQEQHGAFIEEYPGSEANLPLVFRPGQTVTVSLSQISPGTWAFSINGVSGTAAYSGGGTVSWITEAFGASGGVPLPVGDATTFSTLTVNGGAAQIAQGFSMPHLSPPAPPNYRLVYS